MSGSLRQHDHHALLVLPENKLAIAALKQIGPQARQKGQLVTLVGPAGVGKSHLARDLLRGWDQGRGPRKRIHTTASDYAALLAEASSEDGVQQFQRRFRKDVDLLICEDIQILGPRKETQQQLIATVDDVRQDGGSVLFTSTRMPGEIKGLDRRLVNRIHGGLCVPVELPCVESRRLLLEHFLATESIAVSDGAIEQLVREDGTSPRELLALLNQLKSRNRGQRSLAPVTPEAVRQVLAQIPDRTPITLSEIARVTAKTFQVSVSDMKSRRRTQTIALARQTAMYLARDLAQLNYSVIGKYFHRENHSTVIHACRRIVALLDTDTQLSHDVASIRKRLLNGSAG